MSARTGVHVVLLTALAWVWAGFLHPDPYFVRPGRPVEVALLWLFRLGLPAAAVLALLLERRIRDGRTDPRVLLLLAVGLVMAGLVAFPLVTWRKEASLQRSVGQWHPYLQLDPPLCEPRPAAPGPPPVRVFCLGGSTTEFVDAAGRGWPERVEERLAQSSRPRRVEVHRLGRQWYTTLHTLINYEVNLRPHRPDVVVVMHAINDVLQNADFSYFSRGPFREDYGHFFGPLARVGLSGTRPFPERVAARLGALWYHRPRARVDTSDFPGLRPFERNLRSLIALARADGTTVVLMTQPHLYSDANTPEEKRHFFMLDFEAVGPDRQWSYETARRAMRAYNDATRRVAAEEAVALVDLEPQVPKDLAHFTDDVHYTDAAFDVVADAVTRGLEASGVLATSPAASSRR